MAQPTKKKKQAARKITREAMSPKLKGAMVTAVKRQLDMDELPEVRATLDRLIAAGHSRQQAIELIADSFTKAMWIIVDDPGAPDLEQYKALLDELK